MHDKENQRWLWRLLRHPLFIACISTGLFGAIVALLGSALQHSNWDKQDRMSRERTQQEKLFDKRVQIIRDLFYLNKKREQTVWNIFHAIGRDDSDEASHHRNIEQEIISKYTALLEEIKIYFAIQEGEELLKNAYEIGEIWHAVSENSIKAQAKSEDISKESKKIRELTEKIQQRFHEIMTKPDAVTPSTFIIPSAATSEQVGFDKRDNVE